MKTTSKHIKIVLLSTVVALSSLNSFGQGEKPKMDKEKKVEAREMIQAQKIAYITTKLELSPEEAQKFWPVYNKREAELKVIVIARKKTLKAAHDKEGELSDEKVDALINEGFEFEQAKLDIKKKYHDEIKKVLPIKKVAKLYRAEEGFKKHLIKHRMMEKRHHGKQMRGHRLGEGDNNPDKK